MWSFENPTSKQRTIPSPTRPDYTTDGYDVTHAVAKIKDPTTCGRHLDPQAPEYNLPSYREFEIPAPPFKRELNLNITDIEGAQPVSKFVNKNLHGIPSIRTANMQVEDINALQQPHGYLHARGEDYNNLTTADVVTRERVFSRNGVVLAPGHTAAPDAAYFGPCRSPFRDKDYQIHNAQLRTDDIAGLREEREKKLRFKYGLRDETRDANYVADINGERRHNVRVTQDVGFIADNSTKYGADRLGEEREPPKAPGHGVCGRTYGNPDFLKTGPSGQGSAFGRPEDITIEGPEARQATEAARNALERDLDADIRQEMRSEFEGRYAGVKGGLLECACKPEATGLLPGPGAEYYGPRDFRKRAHQIGSDYRNDGPRRPYKQTLRLGALENIDERGCEITPKKVYSPIRGTTRRFPTASSTYEVPRPLQTPPVTLQSVDRVARHRDGYILEKLDTQRREEEKTLKKQTIRRQQTEVEAAEVADLPW